MLVCFYGSDVGALSHPPSVRAPACGAGADAQDAMLPRLCQVLFPLPGRYFSFTQKPQASIRSLTHPLPSIDLPLSVFPFSRSHLPFFTVEARTIERLAGVHTILR